MSFGDEADVDYTTSKGREWPSVRQFNVFLSNRMGALLDLVRRFEQTDVRVVSLTVVETADCAIVRLVPSNYERGYEILTAAKFAFTESDLLVVKLPDDDRAALAERLWESLDEDKMAEDAEFAAELERRAVEAQRGPSVLIPWEQVREMR